MNRFGTGPPIFSGFCEAPKSPPRRFNSAEMLIWSPYVQKRKVVDHRRLQATRSPVHSAGSAKAMMQVPSRKIDQCDGIGHVRRLSFRRRRTMHNRKAIQTVGIQHRGHRMSGGMHLPRKRSRQMFGDVHCATKSCTFETAFLSMSHEVAQKYLSCSAPNPCKYKPLHGRKTPRICVAQSAALRTEVCASAGAPLHLSRHLNQMSHAHQRHRAVP